MRSISTTIAGLIIITFLLVAVIPLVIKLFMQGTEATLRVSEQAARRIAESVPGLSVYEEPSESTLKTKVYYVVNDSPNPEELYILVISGTNGTFLVKVVDALNTWLTAGNTQVIVVPLEKTVMAVETLKINPLGRAKIEVVNGKLLGVITVDGSYVKAFHASSITAEVALTVQSQYINLTGFTSLEDLFNNSDIIITTNLSSTTSEQSLLYSGFIESYCYSGNSNPTRGGFTIAYKSNLKVLYINNLGPDPGMLIVGGRQSDYATKNVTVNIYMPAYTLAPVQEGEPGILVARTSAWDVLCVSIPATTRGRADLFTVCHSFGGDSSVAQFFEQHMLRFSLSENTGTPPDSITIQLANGMFTLDLGLIAYSSTDVLYCPPRLLSGINYDPVSHTESMIFSECILFQLKTSGSPQLDKYTLSNVAITLQGVLIDVDTGIHNFSLVEASGTVDSYTYYDKPGSLVFPDFPIVIKVESTIAAINTLKVYDYTRNRYYNETRAFGIYYYSGYSEGSIVSLYSLNIFSRGGIISVYDFVPGITSGLAPFFIIADTDGNGLAELIFTDEWFKPGPKYTPYAYQEIYDLSDVISDTSYGTFFNSLVGDLELSWYGCIEQTLERLYLKFGPRYAVNGSEIASVSIQIRYSYHDSVVADIDEIDDPKNSIWGFYIVDENGTVVTDTEYIYQQLSVLEDTWPPNSNYVSEAAFLPIPNSPELYYVAWGVSEDYTMDYLNAWPSAAGYINDLEQTVIVEWIGMWYLRR
jgi:hypothetical protein